MVQRKRKRLLIVGGETEPPVESPRGNDDGSGVGSLLRAERLRSRFELRDVAKALRIRLPYLEAIEEGRFNELPGAVYAVGFIRAYARYLGLDQADILRRFKEEAAGANQGTELIFPAPLPEGRLPSGAILLVSLIVAVAAYGGWFYLSSLEEAATTRAPAVPVRLSAAVKDAPAVTTILPETTSNAATTAARPSPPVPVELPPPAPSAIASPIPPQATLPPAPPPPPRLAPVPAPAPAPALTLAAPSAPPPPAAPSFADSNAIPAAPESVGGNTPRLYGEVNIDSRVLIRATAESWIQVNDAGGTIVFMRTMKQGDSYMVPPRPGLFLYTGNAGGLDILVDGRQAPAIGRPGFVRRDVALDPYRLLSGTAVPEANRAKAGGDSGR